MIYQHVNKRTKILPLATSHIAHLCNQFINVCTANSKNFCQNCKNFARHVLKAIIFVKIALNSSYFCKKKENFQVLGIPPPVPRASGGWGLRPQTPKQLLHCEFLTTHLYNAHASVCRFSLLIIKLAKNRSAIETKKSMLLFCDYIPSPVKGPDNGWWLEGLR